MVFKSWLRYYSTGIAGDLLATPDVDTQINLVSANTTRARDAAKNVAKFTFDNPIIDFFHDGVPRRKFIDTDGNNVFAAGQEKAGWSKFEERLELYMKWVDDISEDIVSDDNLVFSGQIKELEVIHENNKVAIKLSCSDRTFNILNKIHGENLESKNSGEIIQEIVRRKTEVSELGILGFNTSGLLTNVGLRYYVDARLFSEGIKGDADTDAVTVVAGKTLTVPTATFVTDLVEEGDLVKNETDYTVAIVKEVISETQIRISKAIFSGGENATVSNGFMIDFRPDGSAFPDISFGMAEKPLNEWIVNLLKEENTNTTAEYDLENNPTVVKRPYIFYIDGRNRLHIFYPDNIPTAEAQVGAETTVGDDDNRYRVYKSKFKQSVFDIINFIIFKAGEDMEGNMISWYAQDPSAGGPIVRDSFRPFIKIAENMKIQDFRAGNITKVGGIEYNYPAGYPMTPTWDRNALSVASDSEYNLNFKEEARRRGRSAAMSIIDRTANPRYQGSAEFQFFNFNPADLMQFTDREIGINGIKFRIEKVQHNYNKGGAFTTLTLKEDIPEAGT